MRFTRYDQLHGALCISENPYQPIGIMKQQIWAFIRGETTGESKSESVEIENLGSLGDFEGRSTLQCNLPNVTRSDVFDQRFSRSVPHSPDRCVRGSADLPFHLLQAADPAFVSAGILPQLMSFV
jgi:hypothetical protein